MACFIIYFCFLVYLYNSKYFLFKIKHDYNSHGRICFQHEDSKLTIYPCRICGVGSGVVYPSIELFCDHMLLHIMNKPLVLPAGAVIPPSLPTGVAHVNTDGI